MANFLLPALLLLTAVVLSLPLGRYMRWALDSHDDLQDMGPRRYGWEQISRRMLGLPTTDGQEWAAYCRSLLVFNLVMFLIVYFVLTLQGRLPLNPDEKTALGPSLAFHTAASFTANTNLQHYSGEVSLSYLSQLGLMWLHATEEPHYVRVFMANLRKKLEQDPSRPKYLLTEQGVGYRFRSDP